MSLLLDSQKKCETKGIAKRMPLLDYARLVAAFLVIYGHLFPFDPDNYVRVFIYQFHMALFFVISGMLHKYDGTIQLRKYLRTIITPAAFYALVFFMITGMLYHLGYGNYKESVMNEIWGGSLWQTYANYLVFSIKGICHGTVMLDGPCWFLIALFYCKIFTNFCLQKKCIGLFLWLVLFYVLCVHLHKYLFVANAIMAMPFYMLGYLYKRKFLDMANMKHPLVLSLVSFIVVLIIMFVNGTVSMWAISFGNFGNLSIPLFYLQGFVGTNMILSLCAVIRTTYPFVTKWANSLISILGLQVLFIFLSDNFLKQEWNYFEAFGVSVIIMLLCICSHEVIIRYCPILIGKSKSKK